MYVVFLPEAEQEMFEAALYYQSQATRLGVDFLSEVERAVKFIAESPNTWPILEGELRRRLTRRFPFGILYRVESEEIVVIAVAHLRRNPGYWKKRIQKT
ncbi:MAG: type II toxin-antitoxin system RelE/ParE family toxin [Deltaproteobacteria bacterium]|nr:type II toxin-antitoxin system RelE/ParE family toxin [Deltaproteobacteria bacterium]